MNEVVGRLVPSGAARRAIAGLTRPAERRRFGRFLVVGLGGTAIDFGLLVGLTALGVSLLPSNSLSFTAGAASNYTWNRVWTFADTPRRGWVTQGARFFLVSLGGLAVNDLIVLAAHGSLGSLLGRPELGYLPAKAAATWVAVCWNYVVNRYWTFGGVRRGRTLEVAR